MLSILQIHSGWVFYHFSWPVIDLSEKEIGKLKILPCRAFNSFPSGTLATFFLKEVWLILLIKEGDIGGEKDDSNNDTGTRECCRYEKTATSNHPLPPHVEVSMYVIMWWQKCELKGKGRRQEKTAISSASKVGHNRQWCHWNCHEKLHP